jgi:alcohol dehydrogenase class IV
VIIAALYEGRAIWLNIGAHGLCGFAIGHHPGAGWLGSVHGLAAPLGAFFPIPHGVVCGTLVAEATRINIEALNSSREPQNPALKKYAQIGRC